MRVEEKEGKVAFQSVLGMGCGKGVIIYGGAKMIWRMRKTESTKKEIFIRVSKDLGTVQQDDHGLMGVREIYIRIYIMLFSKIKTSRVPRLMK